MDEYDDNVNEREARNKGERTIEKCTPYLLCVFGNICFGVFNTITKIALDKGMNRYVLVVYGNVFGTLASAPLAFFFERKNNAKISMLVLRDIFILGLLGDVLGRVLYYAGIEYTSTTTAATMSNLMPSITLLFAVLLRMEKLEISKQSTKAKLAGTVVAFGGATIMTLYKGFIIISPLSFVLNTFNQTSSTNDWIKGSFIILVSYLSFSAFYILQAKTVNMYPAPITLTSLTCLSGTLQSAILAVILDHKVASWRISWDITLFAPLYNGVVFVALTMYVQTLVIQKRGPVFMTAFRPLGTIIVVIMGLFILGEPLHFGRKNKAKISLLVWRDIFILGFLGDVLGRTLYYAGMEYTSTTMAAAMSNLMPSITLLFAVLCRMEKLEMSKYSTQAKIVGTIVAFGGATLMTLYKGFSIIPMGFFVHNTLHKTSTSTHSSNDWIKGSFMILATYVSLSAFYILQGRTVKMYPAPITLTSLTCLSGTLQSAVIAVILDHKAASWRLSWDVTLLAPLYNGVVFLALTMYVQTLVIQRRGPVFMTAFRPLGTIIVVIMGLFIVGEPLHLGSVVGAIFIVLGLYVLLWGKEKELKE